MLDPKSGLLNYYLHENEVKQAPRGSIYLEDSVISPSDEDSCTFTVNSASGDIFKLRASDAKFRQEWVNRLRAVAQFLAVQNHPQISSRGFHSMVNIPNMRSLGKLCFYIISFFLPFLFIKTSSSVSCKSQRL